GAVLLVAALIFAVTGPFDRLFQGVVKVYERMLVWALRHRIPVLIFVGGLVIPTFVAFRLTGQELFPDVDSSEFTVHMRAAGGPAVEETERQVDQIEKLIRGYDASAGQLAAEISLALLLGEDDRLENIRAANPDDRAYLDRLEKAARAREQLGELIREG